MNESRKSEKCSGSEEQKKATRNIIIELNKLESKAKDRIEMKRDSWGRY